MLPGLLGVDPDAEEQAAASMGLNLGAYAVRLSGQDCERGTFNHRNAVLYDQRTGARWLFLVTRACLCATAAARWLASLLLIVICFLTYCDQHEHP